METISRVTSKIQQEYADLTDTTTIQEFLDDAYREFLSSSQSRNKALAVPLVSGTMEYDFPDTGIMKIHEVYYETSSSPGDWLQLREKSLDEFNVKRRNWRTTTSATTGPVEYYITSADDGDSGKFQIGLYPPPPTTSAPTYPRVRMYCTVYAQISGSETIPGEMLGGAYFVAYACMRWAELRHPEDVGFWQDRKDMYLGQNIKHVKNVQSQSADLTIVPPSYWATRAI